MSALFQRLRAIADPAYVALIITIVLLLGVNVTRSHERTALARQVRSFSPGLSGGHQAIPGDIVPPIRTTDANGEFAQIVYDGSSRYLLFAFLPNCAACNLATPSFNEIAKEAEAHNVRVRYVSLGSIESTQRFLPKVADAGLVVMMPSKALWRAYRVVSVPQFMVVSEQGRVEWVHNGVMSGGVLDSLRLELRSPQR